MVQWMNVRSVSFDTSFLLKNSSLIDTVIKKLDRDNIKCFVTSTVASELEQLKVWGRISSSDYHDAMRRWKRSRATVIDFKNRLLSDALGKSCLISMEKHMGTKPSDIANDCGILISLLKNGIDVFLSEDFHFTSAITRDVVDNVKHAACTEYHMMCDSLLYSVDSQTFHTAYQNGKIDLDIVQSRMLPIRKSGKLLRGQEDFK